MLRQVNNFKYLGYEISYENEKNIKKTSKIFSNVENSQQQFEKSLVQKFQELIHPPFFFMEAKFGPLQKRIKAELHQSS
jgi:hypothetical protein